MPNYARMYRFGITPWERYRTVAAASITALLDREETGRSRPLGRALDLGCGRGQYPPRTGTQGVGGGGHRLRAGREQDRAAVVQAPPAGLERPCPALRPDLVRPSMIAATLHNFRTVRRRDCPGLSVRNL